jgi:hypothetical protein
MMDMEAHTQPDNSGGTLSDLSAPKKFETPKITIQPTCDQETSEMLEKATQEMGKPYPLAYLLSRDYDDKTETLITAYISTGGIRKSRDESFSLECARGNVDLVSEEIAKLNDNMRERGRQQGTLSKADIASFRDQLNDLRLKLLEAKRDLEERARDRFKFVQIIAENDLGERCHFYFGSAGSFFEKPGGRSTFMHSLAVSEIIQIMAADNTDYKIKSIGGGWIELSPLEMWARAYGTSEQYGGFDAEAAKSDLSNYFAKLQFGFTIR